MRFLMLLVFCFGAYSFAGNGVKEKPFYGEEIKAEKATLLDKVLKNYSKFENSNVVIQAKVEKVCAVKGCWITLQGDNKTFRVKFKDYGFFVPMTLVGKTVWVEGQMSRKEVSVADTKHYLEDAGASKEEIAAVTKPSFEYSIVAKGLKVVTL
ncbi:MAG: DUF4920 domain-containing protein [Pseudomonadota bacterium]